MNLAQDLARVTTGRPMPDGSPGGPPATVFFLNGEDSDSDTVRPRLAALGSLVPRGSRSSQLKARPNFPQP